MGNNYYYEFEYDSKYCYQNSKVLKNKLNIDDAVELEEAERKITSVLTMEAVQKGICGKFDFNHLKKIHKFLFDDIYNWAGKVRLVNISKGKLLCNSLGYDLDFTKIISEEMLKASDKSFKLDYELLIELMERALSKG